MIVVKPTIVAKAMLISSTATETYSAWSSGTAYIVGNRVLRTTTERIYQRLIAGTTATLPESDPTNWLDLSPSNRWAMFDNQVSTTTTATTSLAVTIATGGMDTLMLAGALAYTAVISVRDGLGGTEVYSESIGMTGETPVDWYGYFFYDRLSTTSNTQVVRRGLPPIINGHLTVTLTGGTGNTVALGSLLFGIAQDVGSTNYGARSGITDFSVKSTDAFGTTTFVKRAFSKRLSADMLITNAQLNRIQRLLYSLRATPCIWVGSEEDTLTEALVIYGFYKDFSTTISYPFHSLCSLEIEGLI